MNRILLNEAGLNDLLSRFISKMSNSEFEFATPVFETLFFHGFRIRELANLHLWEKDGLGNIIAATSKGSSPRSIPEFTLHEKVIKSIETGKNLVFTCDYRTYARYFKNNKGCLKLEVGEKQISTHAFRHNLVKQMALDGKTDLQIQQRLGLKTLSVVDQYKSSVFYATYIN